MNSISARKSDIVRNVVNISKDKSLIRSFIAIELVDRDVIERLKDFQYDLLNTGADVKLVKPEHIHLTLRFLGEIEPSMVEAVSIELQKVRFNPFRISLRGAGFFPGKGRIRVVWIGLENGAPEIVNIFNQIEEGLRKLGFRSEKKRFSPHITVARVRSPKEKVKLIELIKRRVNEEFGSFAVRSIKLKKSLLTPMGPIYSTLYEIMEA
jgi:2'-5' RNA ligase